MMDQHLIFLRPSITAASLLLLLLLQTHAFNPSSPITSTTPLLTRLQDIQCELALSIGRIPGTAMPSEWAASGAKLGLTLELEFSNEPADYEMNKERLLKGDALMGSKLYTTYPLNEPTFVSNKGTEIVKVLPGAYGCQIQQVQSQQYALRFFMDCPDGATRNDVELPAERIYFLSSCWNVEDESVLTRAVKRQKEMEESIQQITQQLDIIEKEQQDNNLFQKALKFRESVDLVEKRGKLKVQLQELEQAYPLQSGSVMRGPNDIMFAKEGVIAVKRLRGAMGTREQYHWIGTFTYNEFFEDE
mmetsp:Transcript_32348/g.65822  ORF Transcript_32348/g.65822 Transcript_32348/m.65822 type:complete len:303 (-) Transcript_32348:212-1120(-)